MSKNMEIAKRLVKIAQMVMGSEKRTAGSNLNSGIIKKINDELFKISTGSGNDNEYYAKIPLKKVFDVLKKYKVHAVQEDGTPWAGFLAGREGKAKIDLAPYIDDDTAGEMYENTLLYLSWHRMDSGNYEVIVYLT